MMANRGRGKLSVFKRKGRVLRNYDVRLQGIGPYEEMARIAPAVIDQVYTRDVKARLDQTLGCTAGIANSTATPPPSELPK